MTTRRTDRTAAGVIAVIVLLIGVLVNLPFEFSQYGGYWVKPIDTSGVRTGVADTRTLTHAGWPLRFLSQHVSDDAVSRVTRYWSPGLLCANAVAFAMAAFAAFRFVLRRRQITNAASEPAKIQRRYDLAAATTLVMVPTAALLFAFAQSRRHQQLASILSRQGNCYLASSMPSFLADRMPPILVNCFAKICAADIFVPNDRQVETLLSLDSLVGCSLYTSDKRESSFDPSSLKAIASHGRLTYLTIRNTKLDDQSVRWISQIPFLTELALEGNSIKDSHLESLAELGQLSLLRLINNPCRYEAIPPDSKWLQTVRSLDLSCPPTGAEDSLTLRGCPLIERLVLVRRKLEDNPAEFRLTVDDCPRLTSLTLDRVQKYDLRLRNLPRLVSFGQDMSMAALYLPATTNFPGACWCSRLELDSLPNLSRVKCLSTDLDVISIRDVPNIRSFSLGSFRQHGGGSNTKIEVSPQRIENLLDQLGQLEQLETLRLELCPLQNVDVTKFSQNRSIQRLSLVATDVTAAQARQLADMTQLTDLQLSECAVTSTDVEYFLSKLPHLRSLGCNVFDIDALQIENNAQLERLLITAMDSAKSIRFKNVPQLNTSLYLLSPPEELTIVDSPGLLHLVVDGPWPKKSEVRGLRMLQCFAGGGPALNDQILGELRYCSQLDELTLAYATLSQESLRTIRQFKKLTTLHLPSSAVDDSIVESWRPVRRLQHVNLDSTLVDVGTIRWAKNLPNLKSFSVNHVRLSDQARDEVSLLGNIQELGLSGIQLSKPQLQKLLAPGRVTDLELGGIIIDDDLIDMLAATKSLTRLTIAPTDIDIDRLKTLLQLCPSLEVRFTRPNVQLPTDLIAELKERTRSRDRMSAIYMAQPMPDSNDARLEHVTPKARAAIESTIRIRRKPGKLNLDQLRRSIASEPSRNDRISFDQNGASSSSTASDNAAFASSTAAPVTPP